MEDTLTSLKHLGSSFGRDENTKENNFFSSKSFKNYLWRNYIVRYFYKEFELSKRNDYMNFKLGLFEELLEIDNSKPIHWNMKDLKRKVYCILDCSKNSFKTEKDIQKRDFKNNTEHFGLSICYLLMFIIRGVIKTSRYGKNYFSFGFDFMSVGNERNMRFLNFKLKTKKEVLKVEDVLTEITKPFNNPSYSCDNNYKSGIINKYISYYKNFYMNEYLIK